MKNSALLLLVAWVVVPAPLGQAAPGEPRPEGLPPQAAEETDGGVNHVVQRGETLFSIAEKYYGNGYEWVRLREYNTWVDHEHLNIGEIIYIPEPRRIPAEARAAAAAAGRTNSLNVPSLGGLSWLPGLNEVSLFGRNLSQLLGLLAAWFVTHFSLQGLFVWFAAHLAFVKDVSMKKALRATLQSETLAVVCVAMMAGVAMMLVYVGTTSPGNPVSAELLATAEDYLRTPMGMVLSGILLVGLYVFLGIRFIPQAFGIQAGRGMAVVVIAILIPHLVAMYLVGHRLGVIR